MELNNLPQERLGPPPLVLLVVDDQDTRRRYSETLLLARHSVAEAHDPTHALEKAFHLAPDVVVADLRMPDLDSLELYRRLRADVRTHDMPAVVVTDRPMSEMWSADDRVRFVSTDRAELLAAAIHQLLGAQRSANALPQSSEGAAPAGDERMLTRVRGEYLEMPGLRLTLAQARRLWGIDATTCERILRLLVDANFLSLRSDSTYARSTEGQQYPAPRMVKATLQSKGRAALRRRGGL